GAAGRELHRLAVELRREGVLPERGGDDLRRAGRGGVRVARQERARRGGPGDPGRGGRAAVPPHRHDPVLRQEALTGPPAREDQSLPGGRPAGGPGRSAPAAGPTSTTSNRFGALPTATLATTFRVAVSITATESPMRSV